MSIAVDIKLNSNIASKLTGIEWSLRSLASIAWKMRLDPRVLLIAREFTDHETGRKNKMKALVDELHRRFTLAPDPTHGETINGMFEIGDSLDVDDACLFVAAAAMSVGIPCRIVGARYGQVWTCFVSYEVEHAPDASCATEALSLPRWETIDVLRQNMDREPDERIVAAMEESK